MADISMCGHAYNQALAARRLFLCVVMLPACSYDGAEPTASSVTAGNLLRLAALVPKPHGSGSSGGGKEASASEAMSYHTRAVKTFAAFRVSE